MNRSATGHGSNDSRCLTLRHGALDDLIDPSKHSVLEAIVVAHNSHPMAGASIPPIRLSRSTAPMSSLTLAG